MAKGCEQCLDGWDLAMWALMLALVIACPFTKVEESFNVQATHDILHFRWDLKKYDHFEFPGVVPRTFLGALGLGFLAFPGVQALRLLGVPKSYDLYAVRILLGSLTVGSLVLLRKQITNVFGTEVGRAFALLTCTQFHLLFYASRTLPNTFALVLANIAYTLWLQQRPRGALQVLVFATVVFRCDLLILLGPIGLQMLLSRTLSLWEAFRCCVVAGLCSLGLTVAVDSLMWQRLIWPEGHVLFFNTVLNKSSEWGVAPFHWYLTSALPRALLGAFFLIPVGLYLDRRLLCFLLPILSFLALYSFLPHKELRFIFPALPILNLSAAVAYARIKANQRKSYFWRLASIGCTLLVLSSMGASTILLSAAHANYPGGRALLHLHQREGQSEAAPRHVHIDVLPAMTGISRFLEEGPPWSYSKEEGISSEGLHQKNFTHLVSSQPKVPYYECLSVIKGFSRVVVKLAPVPVAVEVTPQVYIHRRFVGEEHMLGKGCTGDDE